MSQPHAQTLEPHGAFKLLAPYIRWSFMRNLQSRMQELKKEAESRSYAQA